MLCSKLSLSLRSPSTFGVPLYLLPMARTPLVHPSAASDPLFYSWKEPILELGIQFIFNALANPTLTTFLTSSTLAQHLSMKWFGLCVLLTHLMALPPPDFNAHLPAKKPALRSFFTLSRPNGPLGASLVLALRSTLSNCKLCLPMP